jgi:hypothetical protein
VRAEQGEAEIAAHRDTLAVGMQVDVYFHASIEGRRPFDTPRVAVLA